MDTENTLKILKECFTRIVIPQSNVTNNGTPFVSDMFNKFCENNGIKSIKSLPYHISSNGAVENLIKSLKWEIIKTMPDKENTGASHRTVLNWLILTYHNSEHYYTDQRLEFLMFNRKPK